MDPACGGHLNWANCTGGRATKGSLLEHEQLGALDCDVLVVVVDLELLEVDGLLVVVDVELPDVVDLDDVAGEPSRGNGVDAGQRHVTRRDARG